MTHGIERWIEHSRMSDPADRVAALAALPPDVGDLNRVVQGLLIHTEWLDAYGLDVTSFATASRETLPVATRLATLLERDARPLSMARPPGQRAVGTCRDFALVLCAILRSKGIASRVRCGFASYFNRDWEDHWVCEYWDRSAAVWRLSDAQLDEIIANRCGVTFDPADVPRQAFIPAGIAWRDGRNDPNRHGNGQTRGLWYMQVNVVRDHYAVNHREVSAWDGWRNAPPAARSVAPEDLPLLDELARFPEQALVQIAPGWERH